MQQGAGELGIEDCREAQEEESSKRLWSGEKGENERSEKLGTGSVGRIRGSWV
jgi:hypothetical protein